MTDSRFLHFAMNEYELLLCFSINFPGLSPHVWLRSSLRSEKIEKCCLQLFQHFVIFRKEM